MVVTAKIGVDVCCTFNIWMLYEISRLKNKIFLKFSLVDNYSIYMKLVMHILRFQFQFNLMFLGWNHVINSIKPRQYELKREK
jgi:hypothetical protein